MNGMWVVIGVMLVAFGASCFVVAGLQVLR